MGLAQGTLRSDGTAHPSWPHSVLKEVEEPLLSPPGAQMAPTPAILTMGCRQPWFLLQPATLRPGAGVPALCFPHSMLHLQVQSLQDARTGRNLP